MPKHPKNSLLTAKVVNDQLVISVGIETLAFALQNGPSPLGGRITNAKGFAKDIAVRLMNDPSSRGEENSTPFENLLDDAAGSAIECGSKHVHLDGDPIPYPST